jgi:hypothetical protein
MFNPAQQRSLTIRNAHTRFHHFHSAFLSEFSHRVRKARSRQFHQKREDVTSGATSETVKYLAGRTNIEGWSFFVVEGTQTFQVLTGARQTDMLADHLCDIDPFSDLINEVIRNQASPHGRSSSQHAPVRSSKKRSEPIDLQIKIDRSG